MFKPSCSVILLGLLFVTACPAQSASPLQFEPYVFETSRHGHIDAEVAFIEVPRRHDDPDGPSIRLRVVRLASLDPESTAKPVVYLAGGPGGSGVGTARGARWPVFDRVRQQTDVLLLDQRGTGLSERVEDCPWQHGLAAGQTAEPSQYLAELSALALRCVEFWRAQGVDLEAFNSKESAHDIELLRRALGVDRVSLWGMSYGTHLAMAAMRYHGSHIERAVLMGVEGPDDSLKRPLDADRLLQQLDRQLRNSPASSVLGIELLESIKHLLYQLEIEPGQGRIRRFGSTVEVRIGVFDAQLAIAAALGRGETIRILPLTIAEAQRGNYDILAELVHAVRQALGSFSAMPLAMDIASGVSAERLALVRQEESLSMLGQALNFPFPGISELLGIPVLEDDFRGPLISTLPVLMISGELDGRTPAANAEAAAAGLIDVRHLLIENAGHDDALWLAPGVADRIAEFLAGAAKTDERLAGPPLEFAVSVLGELWRILVRGDDGRVRGMVWFVGLLLVGLMLLGLRLLQRWIAARSRPAHAR